MLITEFLTVEHGRMRKMLNRLEDALHADRLTAVSRVSETVPDLFSLIRAHERVESALFLPALKAASSTRVFPDFIKEHHQVWKHLGELETCVRKGYPLATLAATVKKFASTMRGHLAAEEEDLFPYAEALLKRRRSEELVERAIRLEAEELERELREAVPGPGSAGGKA